VNDIDDWPEPTKYTFGPVTAYRSNAGYGTELNLGRRVQLRSRRGTSRMWPHINVKGADENCNRAFVLVLWPLGTLTVWWEPTFRTDADGPCETCRAGFRADGVCEWCGSRPCGCDVLRPDHRACPDLATACDRCRTEFNAWLDEGKPGKPETA
jgi:hypothetical protein